MNGLEAFWVENSQGILWLLAMVVLLLVEAGTAQMVCIWFAAGALAASLAAMLGFSTAVQMLTFVAVSTVTLVFTRPFVAKALKVKKTATNADSVIGLCGSVIQDIDNLAQTGRVRVSGQDWTARTADNSVIGIGETVTVQAINGVKLIVSRRE